MTILWIFLGFVVVVFLARFLTNRRIASLRDSGSLPEEGQATMADVERLLHSGNKIWAIRCYREIHNVGLREAKEAVEKIKLSN